MKPHELVATKHKDKKRLGRGIGSGTGKTSGRGTKGQNSRTGGGVKLGFEGGQTKLSMRLPKARGFTAWKPTQYQIITLSQLESLNKTTVSPKDLAAAKIAPKNLPIKLLANGKITKSVALSVEAASRSAIVQVEKAGGSVTIIEGPHSRKPKKTAKPDQATSAETTPSAKQTKETTKEENTQQPAVKKSITENNPTAKTAKPKPAPVKKKS